MASRRGRMYTAPVRATPSFCILARPRPIGVTNESDKAHRMSGFKEPSFTDRQKAAQQARQNTLNKFRSQPGPDDPEVKQRQAERGVHAAERAKTKLVREAAKAERKRRDAEAAVEAAAKLAREKQEAAAREVALE